jgi:hypothetical protein
MVLAEADPTVDFVIVLRESVLAVDAFDFFAMDAHDEDVFGFDVVLGVALLLSDESAPGDDAEPAGFTGSA